jgi:hypothetical protein
MPDLVSTLTIVARTADFAQLSSRSRCHGSGITAGPRRAPPAVSPRGSGGQSPPFTRVLRITVLRESLGGPATIGPAIIGIPTIDTATIGIAAIGTAIRRRPVLRAAAWQQIYLGRLSRRMPRGDGGNMQDLLNEFAKQSSHCVIEGCTALLRRAAPRSSAPRPSGLRPSVPRSSAPRPSAASRSSSALRPSSVRRSSSGRGLV